MRLKGKRVFITAAGAGIGRASAEACIREGAEVIATDINAELLEGLGLPDAGPGLPERRPDRPAGWWGKRKRAV